MNGCIDVAISYAVDSLGLQHWSIHLYKEHRASFPPTNDDANDDSRHHTVYQCAGNLHNFRVTVDSDYNPIQEPHLDFCQRVGDRLLDIEMRYADEALRGVPVDNTSWVYSSQIWVFDALDALYDIDLLPDDHYALAHLTLCDFHQRIQEMPGDVEYFLPGDMDL
jgi:hypothetical protein